MPRFRDLNVPTRAAIFIFIIVVLLILILAAIGYSMGRWEVA